jgi:virulence factor BrkB
LRPTGIALVGRMTKQGPSLFQCVLDERHARHSARKSTPMTAFQEPTSHFRIDATDTRRNIRARSVRGLPNQDLRRRRITAAAKQSATRWQTMSTLWTLLRETVSRWSEHKDARLGAALAYYSVFSLGPLILIAAAIAGLVFGAQAVQGQVFGTLKGLLGDTGAQAIEAMLKGADRPREGIVATVIGVGTLVFAAVGVVVQLKDALNTVWEPTQGFHSRAVYRNRKSGRIVYPVEARRPSCSTTWARN